MLDGELGELVGEWVARLRREVPDAVAVFLTGSQLRGDAGSYSDIDFDILVADGPRDEWPGFLAVRRCAKRAPPGGTKAEESR